MWVIVVCRMVSIFCFISIFCYFIRIQYLAPNLWTSQGRVADLCALVPWRLASACSVGCLAPRPLRSAGARRRSGHSGGAVAPVGVTRVLRECQRQDGRGGRMGRWSSVSIFRWRLLGVQSKLEDTIAVGIQDRRQRRQPRSVLSIFGNSRAFISCHYINITIDDIAPNPSMRRAKGGQSMHVLPSACFVGMPFWFQTDCLNLTNGDPAISSLLFITYTAFGGVFSCDPS